MKMKVTVELIGTHYTRCRLASVLSRNSYLLSCPLAGYGNLLFMGSDAHFGDKVG